MVLELGATDINVTSNTDRRHRQIRRCDADADADVHDGDADADADDDNQLFFIVNDKYSALQDARLNDDRRLVSRVRQPSTRVVEQIRLGRSIERADLVNKIRLTRKTPPTRRFRNLPTKRPRAY